MILGRFLFYSSFELDSQVAPIFFIGSETML